MNIKFRTNGQSLIRCDDFKIAANGQKYLKAEFKTDPVWENYIITACFCKKVSTYHVVLEGNGCCTVPYEVLGAGEFFVSLIGTKKSDSSVRITTEQVKVSVCPGPVLEADNASVPTATEIEQLKAMAGHTLDIAENIRKDASNGVFNGMDGADGASFEVFSDTDQLNSYITGTNATTVRFIWAGEDTVYNYDSMSAQLRKYGVYDAEFGINSDKGTLTGISEAILLAGRLDDNTVRTAVDSYLETERRFIDRSVNDLVNYYLKSDTYTRDEVKALITSIPKFAIQPVDSLPTEDISTETIYLLRDGESSQNLYIEYIYVNGLWECLGAQEVNLTGYAKLTDIPTLAKLGGVSETKAAMLIAVHNTGETSHSDIRRSVSELKADKLDMSGLTDAINTALAEAKESGEFDGEDGYTPVKGVDYFTPKEIADIKAELSAPVVDDGYTIVSSIDEMTDTEKKYVLNGYIYEARTVVTEGETTSPDLFNPTEATASTYLNKRLSGSSGSESSSNGSFITDHISVVDDNGKSLFVDENGNVVSTFKIRFNGTAILGTQSKVVFFYTSADTGALQRAGANILTTTNTTVANGEAVSDLVVKGDSSSMLPTEWNRVTHVKLQYQIATAEIGWDDIKDAVITFDVYNETTEGTTRIEFVNTGELYNSSGNNTTITQSDTVWYAIGDSITSGYLIGGPSKTWVAHVMKYNGYSEESKNLGVAGIGFVREDPTDGNVIQDIIENNNFSAVDLVTVAVGINDWQNNCSIDDVKTAMIACFDKILSENPYCKIFFITPFNKNRGTKETNWALGYEQNGITLEDFVAGQISACKDYGVEVIDMTHSSVINKYNLTSVLYDNTHPNEACHIALGKELARKINFA
ncbi:MAG: SGNH/GDSL hydrolase family protein [Clostridia bacterium]|nr:SGNH/GDSL hydrolase family protein [Clostridia bacterium]